ncbi:MAG: cadherin-like domain-containing protein, partial [bacterium]
LKKMKTARKRIMIVDDHPPVRVAIARTGGSHAHMSGYWTYLNQALDAVDDSAVVAEDMSVTISVLTTDSDPEGNPLTISGVTQGTNGNATHTTSTMTYAPNADYFGNGSFTYTIGDGQGNSDAVTVTVTPVNDAPSFTKGADQTVLEDAGAQTVNGWATSISKGPADEILVGHKRLSTSIRRQAL